MTTTLTPTISWATISCTTIIAPAQDVTGMVTSIAFANEIALSAAARGISALHDAWDAKRGPDGVVPLGVFLTLDDVQALPMGTP